MEWRWCSTAARVVCSLPCGTAQQCCPRHAGLPARCGSSLQRNDAGVWLCEYPGLSFQRSPVCACSLVSSLLLSGATMSQQSSLTQSAHSVRQVLTAYRCHTCRTCSKISPIPRLAQHLLRGRCEQRLKSLVSVDRKHPVVLPVVLEHRMGP